MINQSKDWTFVNKPSRPALSSKEVRYWKQTLKKLLKVGIEVELNLPEKNGSCDKQNYSCQCTAIFKATKPIKGTSQCYEQCTRWDDGNCSIAKEHGCVGINCVAFRQPCSSCSRYDRGCESCPELYSPAKDPRNIRLRVTGDLKPTNFVGSLGEHGVYKVCKDGSLKGDGGIEVATSGRRVEFDSVYSMISKIMNTCATKGAFVDERCSIHVHLLASYLTPGFSSDDSGSKFIKAEVTELERAMPEIIVANFHQLIRRYHCALIWLSAAGESHKNLTRWEKFRKSVLPYSAVRQRMSSLVTNIGSASKSKRKYAMMNYEQMQFNGRGDVTRLHVEGRYMDGNLSAATVTAHAVLLYAIMLKAVEVSKYGLLYSGSTSYMELQNEIYNNLCNRDGPWDGSRFSDTSNLSPYIQNLKKQSKQLIRILRGPMSDLSPAADILSKLADKPLAYSLMEGHSWKEIESWLMPEVSEMDSTEYEILQLVDLGVISSCVDEKEWVGAVAEQIATSAVEGESPVTRDSLQKYVANLAAHRKIHWSKEAGSYISGR